MSVKVSSKNLIPYPSNYGSATVGGVTFTDNKDGTYTANGTATENGTYGIRVNLSLEVNEPMVLSGCPKGGSQNTYYMGAVRQGESSIADTGNSAVVTNGLITQIFIAYKAGTVFDNTIFKPMLETGTKATEFTPYVDDDDVSTVTVTKTGLNIWDEQWESGTITNQGVNQSATGIIRSKNYIPVKGGIKYGIVAPHMSRVVMFDTNKKYYNHVYPSKNGSFTPSNDGYIKFAVGTIGDTPEVVEYGNDICISVYNEATAGVYEPYKEETYTLNVGGTAENVAAPYERTTTFRTDTAGVTIECEYIVDTKKYIDRKFAELQALILEA